MTRIQTEIQNWFNGIYRSKGFRYLRPPQAYEIFISILSVEENRKILDVGSGLGLLLKLMVNRGLTTFGVDISDEAVKISRSYCPKATIIQANAENLPFDDKKFDYITCIGSFERMLDRKKAIEEQIRVARDSAKFCYMVRNSDHISWRLLLKPFRLYNRRGHQDALSYSEWTELFHTAGLRILAVYPDHWPYYRFRKSIPLWNKNIDYSRIRKFPFSLNRTYEFIFLLEKNE